eukprot:sb/3477115/
MNNIFSTAYSTAQEFDRPWDLHAPAGCASSEGFLITHPASPSGSFRPFHINNAVAMATVCKQQLYSFVPQLWAYKVFYEGVLSLRYRLTNDDFDVHLQPIIEIESIHTKN